MKLQKGAHDMANFRIRDTGLADFILINNHWLRKRLAARYRTLHPQMAAPRTLHAVVGDIETPRLVSVNSFAAMIPIRTRWRENWLTEWGRAWTH